MYIGTYQVIPSCRLMACEKKLSWLVMNTQQAQTYFNRSHRFEPLVLLEARNFYSRFYGSNFLLTWLCVHSQKVETSILSILSPRLLLCKEH